MKVGDLVELSDYGNKITENTWLSGKAGLIKAKREKGHFEFTHIVVWYGVHPDDREVISDHPPRDLKLLTR